MALVLGALIHVAAGAVKLRIFLPNSNGIIGVFSNAVSQGVTGGVAGIDRPVLTVLTFIRGNTSSEIREKKFA